jgi:hypothetical protein
MSDFLADLVDRARDSATGLERRRPSRFEPPVDAPGLDVGLSRRRPDRRPNEDDGAADAGSVEVEAEAPAPPAVGAPRRTTPRPSASRPASDRRPESTSAAMPDVESPIEPAGGPRPDRRSTPAAAPPAPRVTAPPAARSIATIVEEAATRLPQPSARPTREAAVGRDVPPVARPEPALAIPSTARPAVRTDRSSQARAPEETSARRDVSTTVRTTAVVVRPPMPTLSRPAARRSEPPPPAIGRETPPAVAPTIQVTIGRIEVRATPAPASPARGPRSTTPALSLEDYLRQRSGGAT